MFENDNVKCIIYGFKYEEKNMTTVWERICNKMKSLMRCVSSLLAEIVFTLFPMIRARQESRFIGDFEVNSPTGSFKSTGRESL